MEYNYIDGKIRESLNDLEVNPPVEAWLCISDTLDRRPRRRVMPVLLKMAAAITTLMVAVFSLWYLVLNRAGQDVGIVQQSVSEEFNPLTANALSALNVAEPFASPLIISRPGSGTDLSAVNSSLSVPLMASLDGQAVPAYPALMVVNAADRALPESIYMDRNGVILLDDGGSRLIDYLSSALDIYPMSVSLGAHFSPQYSFRMVSAKGDFGMANIPFHRLEEQFTTFSLGMSAAFEIAPRLTIQTGLNFMSMGQHVRDIISYSHPARLPLYKNSITGSKAVQHPQSIITSQGSIRLNDNHYYFTDIRSHRVLTNKQATQGTDPIKLSRSGEGLTQVFRFIELPLVLRYNLIAQHGIGLQVKGGMSGNYLLQNDVFLGSDITQNSIGKTYGVRKFNFTAIAGFSMNVPITGRLTLHLEPTAQIFLNPVVRQELMMGRTYPYNFSLQTGVSYGF